METFIRCCCNVASTCVHLEQWLQLAHSRRAHTAPSLARKLSLSLAPQNLSTHETTCTPPHLLVSCRQRHVSKRKTNSPSGGRECYHGPCGPLTLSPENIGHLYRWPQ
jgi:hypothetical protein